MKAKKKPVIVDYFCNHKDLKELSKWVESFGDITSHHFSTVIDNSELYVKTLEGTSYKVTDKDVIIRGVKGEYYPCKRSIFEKTYDIIHE